MKPIQLASLAIEHPPFAEVVDAAECLSKGEVDNRTIDPSFWDPVLFFEALQARGYRKRECEKYASLTLTYANDSCRWHTDPGLGVVAGWLVYSENDIFFDAELITRHGNLPLRENDLFIFDADKGHAWISEGLCILVMATVAKMRRR